MSLRQLRQDINVVEQPARYTMLAKAVNGEGHIGEPESEHWIGFEVWAGAQCLITRVLGA